MDTSHKPRIGVKKSVSREPNVTEKRLDPIRGEAQKVPLNVSNKNTSLGERSQQRFPYPQREFDDSKMEVDSRFDELPYIKEKQGKKLQFASKEEMQHSTSIKRLTSAAEQSEILTSIRPSHSGYSPMQRHTGIRSASGSQSGHSYTSKTVLGDMRDFSSQSQRQVSRSFSSGMILQGHRPNYAGSSYAKGKNHQMVDLQHSPRHIKSRHPPLTTTILGSSRPDKFQPKTYSRRNLGKRPPRFPSKEKRSLQRNPSFESDILEIKNRLGMIHADGKQRQSLILKEANGINDKAEDLKRHAKKEIITNTAALNHRQGLRARKATISRARKLREKASKEKAHHSRPKKTRTYDGGEFEGENGSEGESVSSGYDAEHDWQMGVDDAEEYISEIEEFEEAEVESTEEYELEWILSEKEIADLCKIFIQMLMDICTQNRILNDIKKKIRCLTILIDFDCMTICELRQLRALRFCLEMEKMRQLCYLRKATDFLAKVPLGPWDDIPIVTNDLDEFAPSELSCTVCEAIIRTYTGDCMCLLFR